MTLAQEVPIGLQKRVNASLRMRLAAVFSERPARDCGAPFPLDLRDDTATVDSSRFPSGVHSCEGTGGFFSCDLFQRKWREYASSSAFSPVFENRSLFFHFPPFQPQ